MTVLTVQEVSRRSGLSDPTLRYYEESEPTGVTDEDHTAGTVAECSVR